MKTLGITNGCNASPPLFCPNDPLKRWQFAVFLIRSIYGGDGFSYPSTPYFEDVPPGPFYFPHVQKMRELGLTKGCSVSPALFCPDFNTTNKQAAAFAIRAAQRKPGNHLFLSSDPAVPVDDDFQTHSPAAWFWDVPWWYEPLFFRMIQKVRDLAVIIGCAPGWFCPDSDITRGEVTYYIVRGVLDEYPPPNGFPSSANPKLAAGTKLDGNIHFVPFNDYLNSTPFPIAPCTNRLTFRDCTKRFVESLVKQGVTGVRVTFGLMGAVGSTALDANGDVRPEWLGRVGLFFMDLRQAGILRVALHPALGNHQDPASFVSLPDCNQVQVPRYFWQTSPIAYIPDGGGGFKPDNSYGGSFPYGPGSYNCSPANPVFLGWGKIYKLMDQVVVKAVEQGLAVDELEILSEMNLQDFSIQARFIYDNKHGVEGTPCEINRVWQNSRTVLACFRRILEINGFSPGGATISVTEGRTTGMGSVPDCNSVYGDSARVLGLSAFHAAVLGGRIGRPTGVNFSYGLECDGDIIQQNGQEVLPYSPQPQPGLIDMHAYPCVAISPDNTGDCDLTKSGTWISEEARRLSDAIAGFRNSRWPGARILFGETHNNDVLNNPPYQGNVQCILAPLSSSLDTVSGFNQSALASQAATFRPFSVLLEWERTCLPWPPHWNKGNGPYGTQ